MPSWFQSNHVTRNLLISEISLYPHHTFLSKICFRSIFESKSPHRRQTAASGKQIVFLDNFFYIGSFKNKNFNSFTTLPFVAGFQNGRPVVTIKAVNDLGGNESTLTLDEAASVAVTRPETPSKLYLVDDLGNVYEMDKENQNETDYSFRTSAADLTGIGDHFKVAEKIVNNKPDYSGLVWGYSDNKISIVTDDTATSIPTPKVGSYILENITFDMLSFSTDKTLAYSIDIDKSRFFDVGGGYIQLDIELVESAKINFIGFGSDVTNMLRPEFFKDVSGSKAKFDGPSVLYNLKYNTSNGTAAGCFLSGGDVYSWYWSWLST